jgi:hypothetical protein
MHLPCLCFDEMHGHPYLARIVWLLAEFVLPLKLTYCDKGDQDLPARFISYKSPSTRAKSHPLSGLLKLTSLPHTPLAHHTCRNTTLQQAWQALPLVNSDGIIMRVRAGSLSATPVVPK